MFAVFVQDFSEYAVALHGRAAATPRSSGRRSGLVARPVVPAETEDAFVSEVVSYAGVWTMNP